MQYAYDIIDNVKKVEEQVVERRNRRDFHNGEDSFFIKRNFSRNQTISGIEKEKSARLENRKLIIQRRKISSFFTFILIFIVAVIIILFQFVASVDIEGEKTEKSIPKEKYISAINQYYYKQPIERIRANLKKDDLVAYLQREYPEVDDVLNISMVSLTKYKFKIKFRQPVASWTSNNKTLYVDKNGVSFSDNYYSSPRLSVIDESNIRTHSGKSIASSSFIGFVGRIVSEADSRGIYIEKIVIPPASLRQIQISVKDISYSIKLLTTASPEGQIANLDSAIKYFSSNKINPKYLDLRVEGKGYYKLK